MYTNDLLLNKFKEFEISKSLTNQIQGGYVVVGSSIDSSGVTYMDVQYEDGTSTCGIPFGCDNSIASTNIGHAL